MGDSLSNVICRLRDTTSRLNAASDQANLAVRQVEVFLNQECGAGIHASVEVKTERDPDNGIVYQTYLSYCRVGGKYRIAVISSMDVAPEDATVKPWSDCPRDLKLETITKLPDLISEIARELDEQLKGFKSATDAVALIHKTLSSQRS